MSPSTPTNPPVFLLKTATTPRDLYDEYFRNNKFSTPSSPNQYGFDPVFVPVLSHRMHTENLALIETFFTAQNHNDEQKQTGSFVGDNPSYGGMIFTSQRAVEALRHVLEQGNISESAASASRNMVLYTVGPATTRLLTPLRDQYLPHASIHGEEAGTGEKLAHIILEHYNSLHSTKTENTKPALLFLVGEQRRDIIPRTLMSPSLDGSRRIRVDELVVYETGEMPEFEASFRDAVEAGERVVDSLIDTNPEDTASATMWAVVFSPTGCDAMLRVLGNLSQRNGGRHGKTCLIATIGPTTRDHLRNKYGVDPDAVAETPSPEGVGEAIRKFYSTY